MATRTWQGLVSSDWNNASNWLLTFVPTASDNAVFNSTALCDIDSVAECLDLTFSNSSPNFILSNLSSVLSIYGNLALFAGANFTSSGDLTFKSTATGKTVTSAGLDLGHVLFDGVGGAWTLQDALTAIGIGLGGGVELTNGSLITGNNAITTQSFLSDNANTRALTLGSNTITLTGSGLIWDTTLNSGLTFNAGTSMIKLTNNSSIDKTFNDESLTFYDFWNATQGTGKVIINTNGSIHIFKSNAGRTNRFTAGTDLEISGAPGIDIDGAAGNLTVIESTGSSFGWGINGDHTVNYVNFSNCHVTGGVITAYNSVDNGGNSGIVFVSPSPPTGISQVKTIDGVAKANVKTKNGIAIVNIKALGD